MRGGRGKTKRLRIFYLPRAIFAIPGPPWLGVYSRRGRSHINSFTWCVNYFASPNVFVFRVSGESKFYITQASSKAIREAAQAVRIGNFKLSLSGLLRMLRLVTFVGRFPLRLWRYLVQVTVKSIPIMIHSSSTIRYGIRHLPVNQSSIKTDRSFSAVIASASAPVGARYRYLIDLAWDRVRAGKAAAGATPAARMNSTTESLSLNRTMLNKETFKGSKSEFGDQRESYYVVVICGGMRTSWRKWKKWVDSFILNQFIKFLSNVGHGDL